MNQPSEHDEQVAVCRWLTYRGIPYFAVPNGGLRNVITATRLKAEGVKPGVGDLMIFLPNGINLSLEMKTRNGGRVSTEQREWMDFFSSRPGWAGRVAMGAKEAIEIIESLLT